MCSPVPEAISKTSPSENRTGKYLLRTSKMGPLFLAFEGDILLRLSEASRGNPVESPGGAELQKACRGDELAAELRISPAPTMRPPALVGIDLEEMARDFLRRVFNMMSCQREIS
mmetsp:Transcript_43380/g.92893  ORF Transcript_43380/g.92893 Transcript_43380/m.92893 type:complete len:115 (+) Transcript_43380:895-1239(+)